MGKRQRKKKQKNKRPPAKKNPQTPRVVTPATKNGQLIHDLMTKKGVKGSYKDYVAIAGNRLIDWTNSWDIFNPKGETVGYEGVVLLHKSQLHKHIGTQMADKLWHPKLGRIPPKQQVRNPNAARSKSP